MATLADLKKLVIDPTRAKVKAAVDPLTVNKAKFLANLESVRDKIVSGVEGTRADAYSFIKNAEGEFVTFKAKLGNKAFDTGLLTDKRGYITVARENAKTLLDGLIALTKEGKFDQKLATFEMRKKKK